MRFMLQTTEKYLQKSNLLSRLEARHRLLAQALLEGELVMTLLWLAEGSGLLTTYFVACVTYGTH